MSKTFFQVVLITGSSGIAGRQLVNTLLHRGWEVTGLSHRALLQPGAVPMIHVDLCDVQHNAQMPQSLSIVTHTSYSAWTSTGNWSEMAEPNVIMLHSLADHVEQNAPLQVVSLTQGYKVYGVHFGFSKTPAQESDPGVLGVGLNVAQLVWFRHFQQGKTRCWSATRPGMVDSPVLGNVMNLTSSIVLYASLCRTPGLPLRFPGTLITRHSIVDHIDADLLAEAALWAAISSAGENEALNVNNGDIRRWHELWPRTAQWFELECAPSTRLSFHQLFNDYCAIWCELVEERLAEADILHLSGGQFANFTFGWQYDMFGDGSKSCRAGFQWIQATNEVFSSLSSQLRMVRVVP